MKKVSLFTISIILLLIIISCGTKFEQPKKYVIDIKPTSNGTLNLSGKVEGLVGENKTFTFTPAFGYKSNPIFDGIQMSLINGTLTLSNITAGEHQLDPNFIPGLGAYLMSKQWVNDSDEVFQQNKQKWGTYENVDHPVLTFVKDSIHINYGESHGVLTEPWSTDETTNPATVSFGGYTFTLQKGNGKFIKLIDVEPNVLNLILRSNE